MKCSNINNLRSSSAQSSSSYLQFPYFWYWTIELETRTRAPYIRSIMYETYLRLQRNSLLRYQKVSCRSTEERTRVHNNSAQANFHINFDSIRQRDREDESQNEVKLEVNSTSSSPGKWWRHQHHLYLWWSPELSQELVRRHQLSSSNSIQELSWPLAGQLLSTRTTAVFFMLSHGHLFISHWIPIALALQRQKECSPVHAGVHVETA